MISKEQQLFKAFKKVSEQEWIAKIEKDLKGKPLSILNYSPEKEIQTKAYFHSDSAKNWQPLAQKPDNSWYVQEHFKGDNDTALNQTILKHLLNGTDAIQVNVTAKTKLINVLNRVGLQYISAEFIFKEITDWNEIKNVFKTDKSPLMLAFDVLIMGIEKGTFNLSLEDFKTYYATLKPLDAKLIHADGYKFGLAGASSVQELAIALAQLSDYTQMLLNEGESLTQIIEKTYSTLAVNEEYFTNIAKFRAYPILLNHFFKSFDAKVNVEHVLINAITNKRHIAKNDKYNNLLRETTQAMAAILGGATNIMVTPFEPTNELSSRMARNIQLILKEEAYFDKVSDPAAGAYYIEDLTNKIEEEAWAFFMEIEANGGYINSLKNNFIQSKINENKQLLIEQLNSGQKTFLGVNKYPSTLEQWVEVRPETISGIEFEPLNEFILEAYYQKPTK